MSIAKDISSSLIESGKVVRGWMGVAIQELTPALAQSFQLPEGQQGGVLISEVHEDGPSAKAGLQRGDVILEYGNESVKDVNSSSQYRGSYESREAKRNQSVARREGNPPDLSFGRAAV